MTKISEELYDCGFKITGEGRRIDIVDSENNKYFEIFFYGKEVLILSPYDYIWAQAIDEIYIMKKLPRVKPKIYLG